MDLREIKDRQLIEDFLRPHPIESSFMLGYLEPDYAGECRWFAAMEEGEEAIRTLALVYDGLSLPALFVSGRADGVSPLLRHFRQELPERVHGRISNGLLDAVKTLYQPTGSMRLMMRMGLNRITFRGRDQGQDDPEVEQLSHRDTGAILQTYAFWPDHFFDPYQLGSGFYYGIRGDDGTIASIAGIQTLSDTYNIAAIGNLVTHPDYRGRGYAKRTNAVLLRKLFERVELVTLDVQSGNAPAIRTYQHFGFQPNSEYFEGELVLKG